MSWVMPLYGKSGCSVSRSAELARPQISPMVCCIWPLMSRRLSLAVNSSSMVVQLPNSAERRVAPQEGAEAMASGRAVRGVGPDAGDEGTDESCGEPLWHG